ncbi:putative pectinesterase inhibitor domain-containing protein [Helianthus debilis subsp. tardiflorus]
MTSLTCFLILLSLYVTAYARINPLIHPAQSQPRTGLVSPDVVAKACEPSPNKALCVSVLKSQTIGYVNDLKQAAYVAIQVASSEAVATSEMIKATRRREEDKDVVEDGIEEETLADCAMNYISLVEILSDAASALMTGPESDVMIEVKAAMTTAETCEKSIASGRKSPMVEEVAKKNENVRKFCSNALSVYNVYATQH